MSNRAKMTAKEAVKVIDEYLQTDGTNKEIIPDTNKRGFIYKLGDESIVIFVQPIGCKNNKRQDWLDTRDSGVKQRRKSWKFALAHNYKYFLLAVNNVEERYKNMVLSLEATEDQISGISYRSNAENKTGTQVNIPINALPKHGEYKRIKTDYDFYISCVNKGSIFEYLKYFDNRPYNNNAINEEKNNSEDEDFEEKSSEEEKESQFVGYNRIYYGIPGCGKSYFVKNKLIKEQENGKEENVFRTTFYLEYSSSDFVGQIMPVVKSNDDGESIATYEPIPGPFTKALEKALLNPQEKIFLVIEEINRGNAPAIFGDLFQLLDRYKDNDNGHELGRSEYPITNEFIQIYFTTQNKERDENGEDLIPFTPGQIVIPPNMYLIATMNTSDQNVFTLDTAFKRRWDRRRIINDWTNDQDLKEFNYLYIPFTDYTWADFVQTVNNHMMKENLDGIILEDKQLGAYFVDKNTLVKKSERYEEANKEKAEDFVYNVIDYIYNDVAKLNPKDWFNKEEVHKDLLSGILDFHNKMNFHFNFDIPEQASVENEETGESTELEDPEASGFSEASESTESTESTEFTESTESSESFEDHDEEEVLNDNE